VVGASFVALGTAIERGASFLAHLLAARVAGPAAFGAYSFALGTASTVATYAGAGIATTATRFSGRYPAGSPGYKGFVRALATLTGGAMIAAAIIMTGGAGWLARRIHGASGLEQALEIAALSSAAVIGVEALRGFLIGQRRHAGVLVLATISGAGLVVGVPLAARSGAGAMLLVQGGVMLAAVVCTGFAVASLGLKPAPADDECGPGWREIASFGCVQLSSAAGIGLASWWIAVLVGRFDPSLQHLGFYAVASQLRGLTALVPGLANQVAYPLLDDAEGEGSRGVARVFVANTRVAAAAGLCVAGGVVPIAPWLLERTYGAAYRDAGLTTALLLVTAIVHMTNGPAANRLSIVSVRAQAVVNTAWTAVMLGCGTWLVPKLGSDGAALTWLMAHVVAAFGVLAALRAHGALPAVAARTNGLAVALALALGLGAWIRFG
jgi:O-antigen/teichoic acid export membrane protein